jgi:hypothetical protein
VAASRRRRERRSADVPQVCEELAAEQNSWNVFTSRTLIISARKPLRESSVASLPEYQPAPLSMVP